MTIGGVHLHVSAQSASVQPTKGVLGLAWRKFFLCFSILFFSALCSRSQCPNTGETKVIKPDKGTGYYFYRFLGDSSFRYFIDGTTFSFNEKDDPGRTFFFINDIGYESNLIKRRDFADFIKGPKPIDVLRGQAKYEQNYFKSADPSIMITDYEPASTKDPDGSEGRIFYLWKKENPSGKQAATQYLLSTLIKDGVVVLSIFPMKVSISESDVLLQIQKYTSHFDALSSNKCSQVLSMPSAP
jgi:hypothetical protein